MSSNSAYFHGVKMPLQFCSEVEVIKATSPDALEGVEITHFFEYSLESKETLHLCNHLVTEVFKPTSFWLRAMNDKYRHLEVDESKIGKWMLFLGSKKVNDVWEKIKNAIKSGDIWYAKVSATNGKHTHAIMIYTKDYTDIDDVVDCLRFLEQSGLKPLNKVIKYKTDNQSKAGIYSANKQKASIYSSATIRDVQINETLSRKLKEM